jgi:hypothetical protein
MAETATLPPPTTPAIPPADMVAPDKKSLLSAETPAADPKGAETVKVEAVKPPEAAPIEYKLVAPEKSGLTETDLKAATELAKTWKLTQEQAQQLVQIKADERAAVTKHISTEQQQLAAKTQDAWETEFKSDKDFGGEKLSTSLKAARRVLQSYADPKWVEALERSPLGSEPGFLRMLARIGARMGEDSSSPAGNHPDMAAKSRQDILYPHFAAK